MCHTRLGRKYTMVIGALITMAWFFAYTQVRTATQNVVFTCFINFFLNIYYGTLYAYTPEVLPSAHRGTGNGIAIGWNRIMGIISAVIATVADVSFDVHSFSFKVELEFDTRMSTLDRGTLYLDLESMLTWNQTGTPVPIYICAALYIVMALVAAVFPFEPYGHRSS